MIRRDFVKAGLAGCAAAVLPSFDTLAAPQKKYLPGVQLYTVRDSINTDVAGTLKHISAIGYQTVEAYSSKEKGLFFGLSPTIFSLVLADAGLTCKSTHIPHTTASDLQDKAAFNSLNHRFDQLTDALARAGLKYAFIGHPDYDLLPDEDSVKRFAESLQKKSELAASKGLKIGVHNHTKEFERTVEGVPMLDYLLTHTSGKGIAYELDLYWCAKAGINPADYLAKHPGMFACWHVKDRNKETGISEVVGKGDIDYTAIFEHTKGLGQPYVEQDICPADPFDSLRQSLEYCMQKGWFKMS